MVLLMTVNPGFSGQEFMEEVVPKISALRAEIDRRALDIDIQVDGGINQATVAEGRRRRARTCWSPATASTARPTTTTRGRSRRCAAAATS